MPEIRINWAAKVFTGWGAALAAGADEKTSLVERSRLRYRTTIAADALHQGLSFALAYPDMARALEEGVSFLTPGYREQLSKALVEVHTNAQLELAASGQ